MAGIMVMDELVEQQKKHKGLESEVETLRKTRDEALSKADRNDIALTTVLGEVADRIEKVATRLQPKVASMV